jgi:hypothetical protein
MDAGQERAPANASDDFLSHKFAHGLLRTESGSKEVLNEMSSLTALYAYHRPIVKGGTLRPAYILAHRPTDYMAFPVGHLELS